MDMNTFAGTAIQSEPFSDLIAELAAKFPIDYLFCFACAGNGRLLDSCFSMDDRTRTYHYGLLVLTSSSPPEEHRMQDYVNTHFAGGTIILLVHHTITAMEELTQANRFFTKVLRYGLELYSAGGKSLQLSFAGLNPKTTLKQAEKAFQRCRPLVTGFLEGAWQCIEKGHYTTATFLLHQAAEQALSMTIRVVMAYRTAMHNISRLLGLCRCFTDQLEPIFDRHTEEGERLFGLLADSYSEARYGEQFSVSREEANQLYTRVMMMADAAEMLCLERMEALRIPVSMKQTKPVEIAEE